MSNRTARPISISQAREMGQYTKQIEKPRVAYLGNELGLVPVAANNEVNTTDHFGRYWIRFQEGNDLEGNASFGKPQKARIGKNMVGRLLPLFPNYPVLVVFDTRSNEWLIDSIAVDEVQKAGQDTRSLNVASQLNSIYIRNIKNASLFAPAEYNGGETRFTVLSYLGHWKEDNLLYDFASPLSADNDLSSYIPSAGNERIVLIAHKWYDRSLQYIASATRTITNAAYTTSDIQALFVQLEDMASPLGLFKLANNQGTVTQEDIIADFRQFINAPQLRGNRTDIDIPVHVLAKHQYLVHGELIVQNEITIEGEVVIWQ